MNPKILKSSSLIGLIIMVFAISSCSSDDTVANRAPNDFSLTKPVDGAEDMNLQPQLEWQAATDPDGDSVTYKVILDTENPPQTAITNNLGVNTFSLESKLEPETTYYWKIIASDINNNTTESHIGSFTTRNMTTSEAIIGKWLYEEDSDEEDFTECEKQNYLKFTEELEYINLINYDSQDGECKGELYAGMYEVIGEDQIKITENGISDLLKIETITNDKLIVDIDGYVLTFRRD